MKRGRRPIILASRSQRRSTLLAMCGIRHTVMISGVPERVGRDGDDPSSVVLENAVRKAADVASHARRGIVIGADTVVSVGGRIVGKMRTRNLVKSTLARLGREASFVYTGLAVIDPATGKSATAVVKTALWMRKIPRNDLDRWIGHLGPYDKAGGFSIEGPGSILFPRVEGCYFNILGLPMAKLYDLVKKLGYDLLDYMVKQKVKSEKRKVAAKR